jgi:hypothetical protein
MVKGLKGYGLTSLTDQITIPVAERLRSNRGEPKVEDVVVVVVVMCFGFAP